VRAAGLAWIERMFAWIVRRELCNAVAWARIWKTQVWKFVALKLFNESKSHFINLSPFSTTIAPKTNDQTRTNTSTKRHRKASTTQSTDPLANYCTKTGSTWQILASHCRFTCTVRGKRGPGCDRAAWWRSVTAAHQVQPSSGLADASRTEKLQSPLS